MPVSSAIPQMLGLSPDGATAIAVKVLAVAGAFVFGLIITGAVIFLLDRALTGGKWKPGLKRFLRRLGGLTASIVAALVLFGSGGEGLFGGGGGEESGTSSQDGSTSPVSVVTTTPPSTPKALATAVSPMDLILNVTILGGTDVQSGRFYQIDGDVEPITFDESKKRLLARKPMDATKLTLAIQFPERNAPARDHPAVNQLERWAEQAGMNVLRPAKP